jgi:hypothetical protein
MLGLRSKQQRCCFIGQISLGEAGATISAGSGCTLTVPTAALPSVGISSSKLIRDGQWCVLSYGLARPGLRVTRNPASLPRAGVTSKSLPDGTVSLESTSDSSIGVQWRFSQDAIKPKALASGKSGEFVLIEPHLTFLAVLSEAAARGLEEQNRRTHELAFT